MLEEKNASVPEDSTEKKKTVETPKEEIIKDDADAIKTETEAETSKAAEDAVPEKSDETEEKVPDRVDEVQESEHVQNESVSAQESVVEKEPADPAEAVKVPEEKIEEPGETAEVSETEKSEATGEEESDTAETETSAEESENQDSESKSEGVEETDETPAAIKETDANDEKRKYKPADYSKLTLDELAHELESLLKDFSIQKAKHQFEEIKSTFNKKYEALKNEAKEKFIKEGGKEEEFVFLTPVKSKFFDLIREFKRKRQLYYRQIEKEQQENLEIKLGLIVKLKDLIDNGDPATMYNQFKELQNEWRNTGQIPRARYNDVWQTYHHHVERFYDLMHLNKEFRDLDFKHNLEEKTKLVERAQKLAESEDVEKAFRELQVLHRMWKEEIGPVSREKREEIWNLFSEATKKIHHRRHEFLKEIETHLAENAEKKRAVIEKIRSIDLEAISSHKGWQDAIKQVEKYREEFFAIGRAPKSVGEKIWQEFKDATRNFNRAKNAFYKKIKSEQLENLAKKIKLVEQAESLKDSEDWDTVTEIFKKIQSDWKKIGHVPRKDSDKIWKRFKNACNHYFDRLHDRQDDVDKELVDIFNKKKAYLNDFKAKIKEEAELTLEKVNEYVTEWRAMGKLPSKMSHIEAKFHKALESAYKKLNIDKDEAVFLKFKHIIDSYIDQNDTYRLNNEQLFIRKKIDELTREIKQLENNVSFISNVSDDNPLIRNVMKNIAQYKKELELWKRKLDYIKKLDY